MNSEDPGNEAREQLLTLLLEEEGLDSRFLPAQTITPGEKMADAPLSFAQQRLWVLDQLEQGNASYHIPLAVHLSGQLHSAELVQSLNEIIRRHEALRTVFTHADGQPAQSVVPPWTIALPTIDLRTCPQSLREGEI